MSGRVLLISLSLIAIGVWDLLTAKTFCQRMAQQARSFSWFVGVNSWIARRYESSFALWSLRATSVLFILTGFRLLWTGGRFCFW